MPELSTLSRERLATCHPDLRTLLYEAINAVDFTVLCGHRGAADQEDAFRQGKTKLHYPDSKHNAEPSLAVDIAPYPVDWNDTARFARLVGYIERIAHEKGIKIRWGGDWNRDGRTSDERFVDMPHIELVSA